MEANKHIEYLLVASLKKGSRASFQKLYEMYSDRVFYFALKYMKSAQYAEDVTQSVFIKVWESREKINPAFDFRNYLFTITKNTIFNIHKRNVNENIIKEQLKSRFDDTYSKVENDFYLADIKSFIDDCVESFPETRKMVYRLSRNEGLSYKEISERLNINQKTIETHIRLVLKSIRKILKKEKIISLLLPAIPVFFINSLCSLI
jgi:RNA polymerase sigma-70 factor (ECF subfamily)